MKRLSWAIFSLLEWLGVLRTAGIAFLALAIFLLAQTRQMDAERKNLEAALDALPVASPAVLNAAKAETSDFPLSDAPPLDVINSLQKLADQRGLFLERAEYKYDQAAFLDVYQIEFPLKGSYRDLRAFLHQAMSAHPSLTLDNLHLSRQDIKSLNIDADVRFILYLRRSDV